jgi:hypothetical protein
VKKRIGLIGEGDSEVIMLNSPDFQELLKRYDINCVGVYNADGSGNFRKFNEKINKFFKIFIDLKVDEVFMLTDLDLEKCISERKNTIYNYHQGQIIIIAVRANESWYLADSITLSSIFKKNYKYIEPENTTSSPFETIHEEFLKNRNRGFGRSKVSLSNIMMKNGFSIENAILHENCDSVKYFYKKITS